MSVSNQTGSNVFLTCEAAGVPLPVVEWVYTAQTGKQIVYPSKSNLTMDTESRNSSLIFFSG